MGWDFRFSRWRVWRWLVFWDAVSCSVLKIDRRFRGTHCRHSLMMEGSKHLWNVSHFYRLSGATSQQTYLSMGFIYWRLSLFLPRCQPNNVGISSYLITWRGKKNPFPKRRGFNTQRRWAKSERKLVTHNLSDRQEYLSFHCIVQLEI
jgi:hypothetical protein